MNAKHPTSELNSVNGLVKVPDRSQDSEVDIDPDFDTEIL